MVFSPHIKHAIKFALKTHEINQKQKRKGKDIPYVIHPLIVSMLLARAGANDELVAAGILHDTIEDSSPQKPVTKKMIAEQFCRRVAVLVDAVTEDMGIEDWELRKQASIRAIHNYDRDMILLKSADVLANTSELVNDIKKDGETVFKRFARGKEKVLTYYIETIKALRSANNRLPKTKKNPFMKELNENARTIEKYL